MKKVMILLALFICAGVGMSGNIRRFGSGLSYGSRITGLPVSNGYLVAAAPTGNKECTDRLLARLNDLCNQRAGLTHAADSPHGLNGNRLNWIRKSRFWVSLMRFKYLATNHVP